MLVHELINVIESNKDFFLSTIAPNPKNMEYFISTDAPRIIFQEFKMDPMVVPIKSITGDIKKSTDKNILFVQFADEFVTDVLDSFAIAISIADNGHIRLFTFEKGASITGDEIAFVCEYLFDGTHKNYGSVRDTSMLSFGQRVVDVLNGKD